MLKFEKLTAPSTGDAIGFENGQPVVTNNPNPRRFESMDFTLKIWRQEGPQDKGNMETYPVTGISDEMSFLEMMDVLNDQLIRDGKDPVAFDHDCREGICGMCSMFINGEAHGPNRKTTTCQLHMRSFKD